MRISTRGRYSLEALLCMALLPGETLSTRAIAKATGVSEGYLEQLFIPLKKAGIVRAFRGPRGGYVPGREPDKISAGEILRTAEGSLQPADCAAADSGKTKACPVSGDCGARQIWMELFSEINNCIDSITLADLVESYRAMDKAEKSV